LLRHTKTTLGLSKKRKIMKNRGFVRQLSLRPAFVWEQEVEVFVKDRVKGHSLNVPCGTSQIGDVRLDIDPSLSMRGAYDFFKDKIPFPKNTFDTVISDPPWKVGHYFRPRLFFSLVDVCKPGGTIIYNATWIPTSKQVELKEAWIRQSSQFSNVSILSVFEKLQSSLLHTRERIEQ
jgi:hypothetical protein